MFLKVLRKQNLPMTHHRTNSAEVLAGSLSECMEAFKAVILLTTVRDSASLLFFFIIKFDI